MCRDSRSQSETVGVVLLIGVVVTVVFVVGVVVMSTQMNNQEASVVSIDADVTSQNITLEHTGGNSIEIARLDVVIRGENSQRYALSEFGQVRGTDPERFEAGDRWLGGHSVPGDRVTILLVDTRDNEELDRVTVNVRQTLAARFTYSPTTPDVGEEVTFDGSSSSDPESNITDYEWTVGGSTVTPSGSDDTLNYTFNSPGSYDVTLTVTNEAGETTSLKRTVDVGGQTPTAEFTVNNSNPSPGETVEFNASLSSSPNGNITDYLWNFDDGTTGSGEIVTHSFSDSKTYNVTLTVVDEFGQTDQRTREITVQSATLPSDAVAFKDQNGNLAYDAGEPTYNASNLVSYDQSGHLIVVREANGTSGFDVEATRLTVRSGAGMKPDSGDVTLKSTTGNVTIAGTVDTTKGSGAATIEAQSSDAEVTGSVTTSSTATITAGGGDLSVLGATVSSDENASFSSTGRMYLNGSTVEANSVPVDSNDNRVVFDGATVTVRQQSFNLNTQEGIWGRDANVTVGPSGATITLVSNAGPVTVDRADLDPGAKLRLAGDGTVSGTNATLTSDSNNVELVSANGDIDINGSLATATDGQVQLDTTGNVSMADAEIESLQSFTVTNVERIRAAGVNVTVSGDSEGISFSTSPGGIVADDSRLVTSAGTTDPINASSDGPISMTNSYIEGQDSVTVTSQEMLTLNGTELDSYPGGVTFESVGQLSMTDLDSYSNGLTATSTAEDVRLDNASVETPGFFTGITIDANAAVSMVDANLSADGNNLEVLAGGPINGTNATLLESNTFDKGVLVDAGGETDLDGSQIRSQNGTVEILSGGPASINESDIEARNDDILVTANGGLEGRNATVESGGDPSFNTSVEILATGRTILNESTVVAKSNDNNVGNISVDGITVQANDANMTADDGRINVSADGAITANRTLFNATDDVVILDTNNNVLISNSTVLSLDTFNVTTGKSIIGQNATITVDGSSSDVVLTGDDRIALDDGDVDVSEGTIEVTSGTTASMDRIAMTSYLSQVLRAGDTLSLNRSNSDITVGFLDIDSDNTVSMENATTYVFDGGKIITARNEVRLDNSTLTSDIGFIYRPVIYIESNTSSVSADDVDLETDDDLFLLADDAISFNRSEFTSSAGAATLDAGTDLEMGESTLDTSGSQSVTAGGRLNATAATLSVDGFDRDISMTSGGDMHLRQADVTVLSSAATLDSGAAIRMSEATLDTADSQSITAGGQLNATGATLTVSDWFEDIDITSDGDMQLVDARLDAGFGGTLRGGPQVGGGPGGGPGKETMFVSGAEFREDGGSTTFQCDKNPDVDGTPAVGSVSCKQGGGGPGPPTIVGPLDANPAIAAASHQSPWLSPIRAGRLTTTISVL